ncbi:VanZ family protein [Caldalkalibacillus uzonensis]|uniref:VanZ family protein n=1 Tax=Caldalkalibacillus uzonensis TaxID=353224 RepID=A0ABU0CV97_9BACI|nr:VanZ family protein [Caldalkalibacillus uzonensis]MDQ0339814.1 VanZ family protein [Caldalkalibacillus uzonensis]
MNSWQIVKHWRWIPAIAWMGLIFYLSSRTGEEIQSMFPMFDRLDWGHFVAYFILGLAYWFALQGYALNEWKRKGWAVLLSFCYGVSDEIHQAFVPGRHPDPLDVVNDVLGATLAMLMVYGWRKWRKNKFMFL